MSTISVGLFSGGRPDYETTCPECGHTGRLVVPLCAHEAELAALRRDVEELRAALEELRAFVHARATAGCYCSEADRYSPDGVWLTPRSRSKFVCDTCQARALKAREEER